MDFRSGRISNYRPDYYGSYRSICLSWVMWDSCSSSCLLQDSSLWVQSNYMILLGKCWWEDNAWEATEALKKFLGPHYHSSNESMFKAFWRSMTECIVSTVPVHQRVKGGADISSSLRRMRMWCFIRIGKVLLFGKLSPWIINRVRYKWRTSVVRITEIGK